MWHKEMLRKKELAAQSIKACLGSSDQKKTRTIFGGKCFLGQLK
jgi:hypothetical protein